MVVSASVVGKAKPLFVKLKSRLTPWDDPVETMKKRKEKNQGEKTRERSG